MTDEGRFAGGCEARALETALFLHLEGVLGEEGSTAPRLAAYCRRYLDEPPGGAGIDALLSALICRQVLGDELSPADHAALDAGLARFDHPTHKRKRVFFSVILAEIGAVAPPDLAFPAAAARQANNQLWVSVILTSLRILLAHLRGGLGDVGDEEIAFIVDTQGADGGWEQHVLATIVALTALVRAGYRGPALRAGVDYVRRQLREDGGIPFIADEDVWVTCLSGYVLAMARPSTCDLNKVAGYVTRLQADNGGWPYSEGVRQTDADDTFIALSFLSIHDAVGHREAIRRAQWYLIALQNEDGGFPTFVRGATSEAEITAKAIIAMRSSSAASFAGRIARAWRWLAAAQRDDGSFRAEWKLCATYPALHVLSAAALFEGDPIAERVRSRTLAFLRRWRRPDGGWGLRESGGELHLLSTAYALAGLATDREGLERIEFGRSLGLLLEMQGSDGGYHGSGDSLGPRPFVYDVPLLASVYSLLALSYSRVALLRHIQRDVDRRDRPTRPAWRLVGGI
ncbi:MAG: prenyltransferase/squalene oxidase repeat-containing protein [Nannocystaceae bacterium]